MEPTLRAWEALRLSSFETLRHWESAECARVFAAGRASHVRNGLAYKDEAGIFVPPSEGGVWRVVERRFTREDTLEPHRVRIHSVDRGQLKRSRSVCPQKSCRHLGVPMASGTVQRPSKGFGGGRAKCPKLAVGGHFWRGGLRLHFTSHGKSTASNTRSHQPWTEYRTGHVNCSTDVLLLYSTNTVAPISNLAAGIERVRALLPSGPRQARALRWPCRAA